MTIIDEYFDYCVKYTKLHGPNTLVFIQVGSFYEAYCTATEGPDLETITQKLDFRFTRRNTKTDKAPDRKNPNMAGFPIMATSKYLDIFTEGGYTVVLFNQVKEKGEKEISRVFCGAFGPGTHISETSQDVHYNLTIYISEEKQLFSGKILHAIGLTLLDVSTGELIIHEFYGKETDEMFSLDELLRIMQSYKPIMTLIYYHPVSINDTIISDLKKYLGLEFINHQFYIYFDKKGNDKYKMLDETSFKTSVQNEYFSKIFCIQNRASLGKKQSPLEVIGVEDKIYVTISLIMMLKYISTFDVKLLNNLSYPTVFIYNEHLVLGNNALQQLNIIDANGLESYNRKLESVLSVIDKTNTSLGKRFLRKNLISPLSAQKKNILVKRYDYIEALIKDGFYKKIQSHLKNISDIERLHRKMTCGTIVPDDFCRLDLSYHAIFKIMRFVKKNKVLESIISDSDIKKLELYQLTYNNHLDMEKLQKAGGDLDNIQESFFAKGIFSKIDDLQENIEMVSTVTSQVLEHFNKVIINVFGGKNQKYVSLNYNDKEGYHFTTSNKRVQYIKNGIVKPIIITTENDRIVIKPSDLYYVQLKGSTKIFIKSIEEHTRNLALYREKFSSTIRKKFRSLMSEYYNDNKTLFFILSNFISELDFYVSGATVAVEYFYNRPIIPSITKNNEEILPSYIQVKRLRHSIIEKINKETEYIPHDLEIGNIDNKNGILLYGLNSSGKCLDPKTPVLMFDGTIKQAKNVVIGDKLMGDDSKVRNVITTCGGRAPMFCIKPQFGDEYIVNGPHILSLMHNVSREVIDVSVDDFLQWTIDEKNLYYTYHVAVEFPERVTPIDPKLYAQSGITSIDSLYLINSRTVRLRLLEGLLKNNIILCPTCQFYKDVKFLLNTLNIMFYENNGKIHVFGDIPTYDKILSSDIGKYQYILSPFTIVPIGQGEYSGFEIDGNKRFLLGDCTVTHNSSLMKSIGISVILAQIGYYVPAQEFIYEPYLALYARITGNDNMLKGLSSFQLEMSELDAIVQRTEKNGENTLVIGDEVCRGTEGISATSIVAAALVHLSKHNTTFVFASHLHDLPRLSEIQKLTNLRLFHLRVEYDEKNDCLIFDRSLKSGSGPPIYGLMVAKYMIKNKDFLITADKIQKKIISTKSSYETKDVDNLPLKSSKYNKELLVTSCAICNYKPTKDFHKELETHHIHFQKNCWEDGKIKEKPYLHKNRLSNLVVLCRKCHEKVHRGQITIKGYVDTSIGVMLDYSIDIRKMYEI